MDPDTQMGGPRSRFPTTLGSVVRGIGSEDAEVRRRSGEAIVRMYWKPVYKYIRVKWQKHNADAQDLTQGFFSTLIEKRSVQVYDPGKARFRTFLRVCLDGYLAHEHEAARRLKRGGHLKFHSLDYATAEEELSRGSDRSSQGVEEYFQQEWMQHVLSLALSRLRIRCADQERQISAQVFERYLLGGADGKPPTQAVLGAEFGLTAAEINKHVTCARRWFREEFLDLLREVTATEEEFREEVRALLGDEAP